MRPLKLTAGTAEILFSLFPSAHVAHVSTLFRPLANLYSEVSDTVPVQVLAVFNWPHWSHPHPPPKLIISRAPLKSTRVVAELIYKGWEGANSTYSPVRWSWQTSTRTPSAIAWCVCLFFSDSRTILPNLPFTFYIGRPSIALEAKAPRARAHTRTHTGKQARPSPFSIHRFNTLVRGFLEGASCL